MYGFFQLKDVFGQRVQQVGVSVVSNAIDETLAEHTRQLDALISLFASPTLDYSRRYKSAAAARLQPLDENGRARPIKPAGYWDIAFPIQDGGAAWGANYKTGVKMTVQEANDAVNTLITADKRWIRDHILAALFANAAWTWTDPEKGDLTIKGLANGDSDLYTIMAGQDQGATDTHYLAQAAAVATATDPFPTIYQELTEHPENGGEVVALVPTTMATAVKSLAGFYPESDPNIRRGDGQSVLVGSLGDMALPGELIGYHDSKVWIATWAGLPDNYIVATTTGGDRPLAMRQEPEPELQGFQRRGRREDWPFWEDQYTRYAGFGAQNRVGALVYRVGNGSYAIPSGYASPMP
jgi:hypothetical protein